MTKSIKVKFSRPALLLIFFALFFCLSGCGGSQDVATADTGTSTDTTTTAAYLNLSASSATVKTDNGITKTTITVTALNAAHAVLPNVKITMSADTGTLDPGTITTGSNGEPATVKFYCDSNPTNRTATITATAGSVSASTLIQIVGSTITLSPTGTITLSASGSPTVTLFATVSDGKGDPVGNTPVTITKTGTGNVTVTPASGTTDAITGQFTATIAGATAGSVTLTVTALGTTAMKAITVSTSASSFGIDKQLLNGTDIGNPKPTTMKISDQLTIEVNAPSVTTVYFATTIGIFTDPADATNTGSAIPITVSGGKATAILTTAKAGIANVQVLNKTTPTTNDSLTVAMTSSAGANSVVLQTTSDVVPKSVDTTIGTSTLIATVRDATLPTGLLVAGAPVSFSIINPTGGGETIYPVVAMTGIDGTARATFISGSVSSDPAGVQIRASVIGTAVSTGTPPTPPSGLDASIIISGTSGSVSFGQATVISEYQQSNYSYPMSVLVADNSGHAVENATITLKLWPVAWSTGHFCTPDPDDGVSKGTFLSEDINANLILDPGEDGLRIYYATGVPATGTPNLDNLLTPENADAGALPKVNGSTDANGVYSFNLIYPKASAIYTIVRLRASTTVQGSETVGEIIFRLPAMLGDVTYVEGSDIVKTCKLNASHYIY